MHYLFDEDALMMLFEPVSFEIAELRITEDGQDRETQDGQDRITQGR